MILSAGWFLVKLIHPIFVLLTMQFRSHALRITLGFVQKNNNNIAMFRSFEESNVTKPNKKFNIER